MNESNTDKSKYEVTVSGVAGAIGDNNTVVMPRRPVRWPVLVGSPPPMASAFQTRSELEQHSAAVSSLVLRGDGGVGKTQLAAKIASCLEMDVRVWVQGESRAAVISGYAEAAIALDLADREIGQAELASYFLGFLASTDRTRLVVIDDLSDPAVMQGLWPAGRGQLVVTTRRRDAALSGGGRTVIDVGVYTPAEAESYLRERFTPLLGSLPAQALDEAAQMAKDLGYLPLGLAQAAAVVIDEGLTCGGYRTMFADRSRDLADLFATVGVDGYDRTVATTWTLAMDAADKIDPAGLARPLGLLAAVCDSAGAPEALYLTDAVQVFVSSRLGVETVSARDARRGLRALHRLSLIDHDLADSNPRAVRMHGLTARAILQDVSEPDRAVAVRVVAAGLAEIWPAIENDPALSECLRANVQTIRRVMPSALWDKGDGGHPSLFVAGQSLADAGLASAAISYFAQLAEECRDRLGPDHPDTLASRNNLAYAYQAAGNLGEAIPLYTRTLADRERVLGPDHPDTLASRNNLAYAYQAAGNLGEAIPLYTRTLADRERVLGPDHPDTLASRNNLAGAYESAGNLGEAIPLYTRTLADRERVLGPDHPDTLTSRNNLAGAYESAGNLGEATSDLVRLGEPAPNLGRRLLQLLRRRGGRRRQPEPGAPTAAAEPQP
ncbi:tetratricopeptide repeat protein [Granulicoccus sp. GXG6511]|uniref:tetratricopeptide repeat protein n=1 Tax=Granulicoccus sp. GXG6511 TaxID=3381351 RepID=UPI003D7F06BF